jgi:Icc protein
MKSAINLLHLTDLHLFADTQRRFNQIDTRQSLLTVINHCQQHYASADAVIITGDLAHDGQIETYQLISELLKPLNAPVYYVLGNHDCREHANQVYPLFPIQTEAHLIINNWQIILVDSNHNPQVNDYQGEVNFAELQRVQQLMDQYPDYSTLIAMHHNLPNHQYRGVVYEVRNHQQVCEFFQQFPKIKVVLSGHVHQEFTIIKQGIAYFSTPSTGYQSLSKSKQVTGEVAGYRWLQLYPNGDVETDVRSVNIWPS